MGRLILFLLLLAGSATAQQTLLLQPGPECGKDVHIWHLEQESPTFGKPWERNFGESYLPVMEWTWGGIPGRRWVLLDFPALRQLPAGASILEARLSLFHLAQNADGSHSTPAETGLPHRWLIQRIIEPWEESAVTWNTRPAFTSENELVMPAPQSNTQNFENLDVTALARDIAADPAAGYGFLLRFELEDYYQKLIFASSEADNPSLRPRLEVIYEGAPLPPPPDVFPETEIRLCEEAAVELNAVIPGAVAYLWEDGSTAPMFQVEEAGTYSVSVTLESCAVVTDSISVVMDDCRCRPVFPNAFSPNGDGVNDLFGILMPEDCQGFQLEFRIFNRWGGEVFQTSTPGEAWDGNLKGRPAPADTYLYTLEFTGANGEHLSLAGDVTLIR